MVQTAITTQKLNKQEAGTLQINKQNLPFFESGLDLRVM